MRVTWVVREADPDLPSGGDRYDAAAVSRWRAAGSQVEVVTATGDWPRPDGAARDELEQRWDRLPDDPVIVDGLIGGACPEAVRRSAGRRPTLLLVHLPLPVEAPADRRDDLAEREHAAARAAHVVVTTSHWAAQDVRDRYPGCAPVLVAAPGVEPAPVSPGHGGEGHVPQLLVLGSLTPRKGLLVLLEALGAVSDLAWQVVLAGPAPDAAHLAALRVAADRTGIADRVHQPGPLTEVDLKEAWAATDLLVHPSRVETFGMVVTEAQARGIPAVVVQGTGAQEALGGTAGTAVGPDADDLAQALRDWLTDPALRRRWRDEALARRASLPGWETTVAALDAAVRRARQEAA
ncbi:glycosyltransferase family 4 protein [Serinicoccus sp. LYQ131]|uniref:glycosyltransferase family 4 protein n=1 Tax=Serinicoccus sp. LYQ131 TaxID=3378797 RepID=UPI003851A52D